MVAPSPQLLFSLLTLSTSRMDALSRAEEESYIALLGILARYITENPCNLSKNASEPRYSYHSQIIVVDFGSPKHAP